MKKKKNLEYFLIVFLFTILIVVCFLQVLFRFVLNLPLAWTEELSRYVFIILIYCGASAAVLDNAHVRVELIDNLLPERARFALDIAVKLLCAAVSLVIAFNSRKIISNASLSRQLSASLRIPMAGLYTLVAVMFCLIAFRFFQAVFRIIARKKEVESES